MLTVQAKDSNGNVIAGSTPFANPIMLSDSDTSGVTSISPTIVTSPATTVTFTYTGTKHVAPVTISATATGVSPTSASFVPAPMFVGQYALPTQSAHAASLTTGPDGNLWFAESNAGSVGRVTMAGQITEFPINPTYPRLCAITAGPDGNLWVAACDDDIHVVSTSGSVVARYSVHDSLDAGGINTMLNGITKGSDGALWFTEYYHGFGRITTTGAITRYPVYSSSPGLSQIVAGPNNTLWAPEQLTDRIAHVTTAGVVSESPTRASSASTVGITAAPDGNLYFPESYVDRMGKIDPSGIATDFALPGTAGQLGSTPTWVVADQDGDLWYTESGGKIGRVVLASGAITEYQFQSPGAGINSIAIGPDGNVWFSYFTSSTSGIGKFMY